MPAASQTEEHSGAGSAALVRFLGSCGAASVGHRKSGRRIHATARVGAPANGSTTWSGRRGPLPRDWLCPPLRRGPLLRTTPQDSRPDHGHHSRAGLWLGRVLRPLPSAVTCWPDASAAIVFWLSGAPDDRLPLMGPRRRQSILTTIGRCGNFVSPRWPQGQSGGRGSRRQDRNQVASSGWPESHFYLAKDSSSSRLRAECLILAGCRRERHGPRFSPSDGLEWFGTSPTDPVTALFEGFPLRKRFSPTSC